MDLSTPSLAGQEKTHLDTRQRLLLAAGEVFAERGLKAATVREIVERAGANIASVNYHFGGKDGLYLEVLRFACQGVSRACDVAPGEAQEADPERRLFLFIRHFLTRCLGARRESWRGRLLAREMAQPSPALKALVDRLMRPVTEQLVGLVMELEPALDERTAWLAAVSIIGQCTYHRHAEAILDRLEAPLPRGAGRIDALAEHILRFSLGGIAGSAEPSQKIDHKE